MGRYLDAIRKSANKEEGNHQNLQNPANDSFEGFVGSSPGTFEKNCPANAGQATDELLDDRRTCDQCANLIARQCQAGKRGEIVANREYEPVRDLPRRCEGYMPGADDPDKRLGRERWPELIQKGGS
jgi:hypothetical protein